MTSRRLLTLTLAALLAACGKPPKVQAPMLVVSPATASFVATAGGAAPATQDLAVTNGGAGALGQPTAQVTYQSGAGWLTEAAVSGAAAPYVLRLGVTPGTLAAGTYQATVRLTSLTSVTSPEVAVTLTVNQGMVVSRQLTSWGQDGGAATGAAADVSSVALLEDDGAGGSVRTALTAGGTAGTWVGAPPARPWWAEVTWVDGHRSWIRGSGPTLDLGEDEGGRAGRAAAAQATPVTPVLDLLDPWGGDAGYLLDTLAVHAWGAQALTWLDQSSTAGFPLYGGETALDGVSLAFSFDWRDARGALLVAADEVTVTQLRPIQKLVGGSALLEYLRAVATTRVTGVAMVDGQGATLGPADMTSLVATDDGSLALDWRRTLFEAALPPYAAVNAATGHLVGVYATPAPLTATAALGAVALPLLVCADPYGVGPDFNGGAVTWARTQPTGWSEYRLARFAKPATVKAPGAATGLPGAEDLVYRYDAAAVAPSPVVPLLSAPVAPTVDGQPALAAAMTGVSLTPVIAWEAPATGLPTSYRLEVHRLALAGTATAGTLVGELVVDGATTSVTLPAGLLQGAATYAVTIAARSSPTDGGGAAVRPYRAGVPFGEARLWTMPFTTAP